MTIDPKHLAAANDNDRKLANNRRAPAPETLQYEFDLQPRPDKEAQPEPAKPVLAAECKSPKPARKRTKLAAGPAPIGAPVSKPAPAPAPKPPAKAAPPELPDATVVSLKAARITRDPYMIQLKQMLGQSFMLNQSCLTLVQLGGETLQEEDSHFRNWGLSTATYVRLLNTLHRHDGFLDKEP